MWLKRHLPFLRNVLLLSFSAFGGPQGHLVMMKKLFVDKRRDITDKELLDFNSFTQLLPGPSSSQTIMLVGLKRGGPILGLLTMLIWVIPACIIMGALSFFVYYIGVSDHQILSIFTFMQPVSIAFIAYAAFLYTRHYVTNTITTVIMILAAVFSVAFLNPWTFPLLIIISAISTTLSSKRIPDKYPDKRKRIQWRILYIFLGVFALLAILATIAIKQDWFGKEAFKLMENFYRFGSIVFGGGQVLLPMMLYQFVYRPAREGVDTMISADQLITGYGLVNSIPGPVYSLAAYVGGIILAPLGLGWHFMGVLIGSIFIFLPGILLIMFLFPLYQNLQYHPLIFRALEGIRAAITGILWGSTIILWRKMIYEPFHLGDTSIYMMLAFTAIIIFGFLLLKNRKISAQIMVVIALILGSILYFLSY